MNRARKKLFTAGHVLKTLAVLAGVAVLLGLLALATKLVGSPMP